MLSGLETFRNVLLVALLLGLAWVLLRRMAHAMRKHEVQAGVVDLKGAGAEVKDDKLIVHAEIQGAGVDPLRVAIKFPSGEDILHDGPADGGEATWEWSIPDEHRGETVEVWVNAPKSRVIRRVVLHRSPA